MDDDNWYRPSYVQDMVNILRASPEHEFVVSGENYYYDLVNNRILKIPAVHELSSCNGVLCYKAEVLKSRRYNSTAKFAEEAQFLKVEKIMQHPHIETVHLTQAHPQNTVTKKITAKAIAMYKR